MRALLAYIIRKDKIVQTYSDYLKYAIPDDKMITRMLYLPQKRTSAFQSMMISQSGCIQQSTRQTIEVSMTYWIRSARTLICIYMSNSISPNDMAERHFMTFI